MYRDKYTCGRCHIEVSKDAADAGKCPYCGVLWSGTQTQTDYVHHSDESVKPISQATAKPVKDLCPQCRAEMPTFHCQSCGYAQWGILIFWLLISPAILIAGLYFVSMAIYSHASPGDRIAGTILSICVIILGGLSTLGLINEVRELVVVRRRLKSKS